MIEDAFTLVGSDATDTEVVRNLDEVLAVAFTDGGESNPEGLFCIDNRDCCVTFCFSILTDFFDIGFVSSSTLITLEDGDVIFLCLESLSNTEVPLLPSILLLVRFSL